MAHRYLVASDLHLADVEDHPDGWKDYKSAKFLFDNEFAALLERFTSRWADEGPLTLILNGDVIDFDLITATPDHPPWPVSRSERRRGLNATEDKSVFKLQLVLEQHPVFVGALARFLAAGHRLVYVMGNHDREFHFPGVKQVLLDALDGAARAEAGSFEPTAVSFEPWFFAVPGEIYAEHGHQYDHYTSFRHVLEPTIDVAGEETIALPMGNLSNRFLMTRMGFFNPHASDYILNMFAYAWHWLRFYAFSRRSLALNWLWGSLVVMGKLLRVRKKLLSKTIDLESDLSRVAARSGLSGPVVEQLYNLRDRPITSRFLAIVREFWIDRLLIALLMTGGTVALALVPIPLWIKLMVPLTAFPLAYFIYEWAVQGESIFAAEKRLPEVARQIADIVPVRVVTFGHTHSPRIIPLRRAVNFVDTGAWAPITRGDPPGQLVPGYRNYLEVSCEGEDACVEFGSWLESASPEEGPTGGAKGSSAS